MSVLNFALAVVLLYFAWSFTVKLGLKRLTCSRSFSSATVFEGDTGELVEVVRNDTPFIIPWLRVESRISPYIRLGRQENLQISGEMYYCSFFTMMPYQQIRRRHHVSFLHRGSYNLGNAALTSGDILGFNEYLKTQSLSTPILVYPSLLEDDALPMPISRVIGELVRKPQLLQDPFLVRGIRSYQPGDPVRDIHWAATAKTAQTQVRVRDYTAHSRLLVVMNVQYQDLQLNSYIPDNQSEQIEYMIRLAATICVKAIRMGLAAGFATNMPLDQKEDSTLLLPSDGVAQEEELLAAFARLNLHCAEKFPAFLDSLASYSDLDILVLSRYDSESIRICLEHLRQSGNQVSFYVTEGGNI